MFEPENRKKAKEFLDVAKDKGTNMEKIKAITLKLTCVPDSCSRG